MDARLAGKMIIVAGLFFFLVWCGVKTAKWADATSKETEARYTESMLVLQGAD